MLLLSKQDWCLYKMACCSCERLTHQLWLFPLGWLCVTCLTQQVAALSYIRQVNQVTPKRFLRVCREEQQLSQCGVTFTVDVSHRCAFWLARVRVGARVMARLGQKHLAEEANTPVKGRGWRVLTKFNCIFSFGWDKPAHGEGHITLGSCWQFISESKEKLWRSHTVIAKQSFLKNQVCFLNRGSGVKRWNLTK